MRITVPLFRTLVLILIFHFTSLSTFAQSFTTGNGKYEVGLSLGPLFFLGDLGGNYGQGTQGFKDVNLPLTKMAKGVFANIYPAEWAGLRLAINQGVLEGSDSIIKSKGGAESARKQRNLQFQSPLLEAFVAAEIYPTVFFERYEGLKGKFRPYAVLGVGMFKFNPKGRYYDPNGTNYLVNLQPLRLEGQGMAEYPDRKEYKLVSMEVPMGFGFKYYYSDNKYIGFEVLHRKTYTDYLDDVSTTYIDGNLFDKYLTPQQAAMARQLYYRENFVPNSTQSRYSVANDQRGNATNKDSYFSSVLRLGWRLNDINSPSGRAARQLRCPTFY